MACILVSHPNRNSVNSTSTEEHRIFFRLVYETITKRAKMKKFMDEKKT